MEEKQFRKFLENEKSFQENTISSRVSAVKRIENEYGDLDKIFNLNSFNELFDALTVGENNSVNHKVNIDGNPITGTATLKSSLGLYNEYKCSFISAPKQSSDIVRSTKRLNKECNVDAILDILKQFIQENGNIFDNSDGSNHEIAGSFQGDLSRLLNSKLEGIIWGTEVSISDSSKDRVDIHGKGADFEIVIELDASRADQVVKKFISRQAILVNKNILYISLCYPGTARMNKRECAKYFGFCSEVSDGLWKENTKKEYIGYFL